MSRETQDRDRLPSTSHACAFRHNIIAIQCYRRLVGQTSDQPFEVYCRGHQDLIGECVAQGVQ